MRRGADNARCRTQSEDGAPQHIPHPAIQQGHRVNDKGDADTQTGDADTQTGSQQHCRPSLTMPPTIHDGTPPSTTAPPSTNVRGERTEDTPPHEHHRHTPTTHTPHTRAENSARHNDSIRQHCNGMNRVRTAPLHWAGQQQYTPPPFHTPRRMDTIHSSTHLLSLIHVHTTDDQR